MTETTTDSPGVPSPAPGPLATPRERAEHLYQLLNFHAWAKRAVAIKYADAFLETGGAEGVRTQTARKAAAELQLEADQARAAVEAYRVQLDLERWAALGPPGMEED